jgi:hypothetical protein
MLKALNTHLVLLLMGFILLSGCRSGQWFPSAKTHSAQALNKREGLSRQPYRLPSRWDELHLDDPTPPGWTTRVKKNREEQR